MTDEVPDLRHRSWWQDWGNTYDVEKCMHPDEECEEGEVDVVVIDESYQPQMADLLIFETNKIDIYFIR